jgi:hypothetical protein
VIAAGGARPSVATMIITTSRSTVADIEVGTGWALKPQGACRGEVCVPLAPGTIAADGTVNIDAFADRLGMPLVRDEASGLSALGPSTSSGHALITAEAPELSLPQLDGTMFHLSSLRGRKVVLVAWSPY